MKTFIYFILYFFASASFADKKSVTIITYEAPPFMSPSMPEQGAGSYALKEMFKKAGYDCKLVFAPLKRAKVEALKDPSYAGYFPVSPYDLAEGFIRSQPVYRSPWVIVERVDKPIHYKTFKDLAAYKGGIVLQYTEPPEIRQLIANKTLNVEEVANDTLNLLKLATKRVDYVLIDATMFKFITQTDPRLSEFKNTLRINPKIIELLDYSIAFKLEDANIQIQKDFDRVFNREEFTKLIENYLMNLMKAPR